MRPTVLFQSPIPDVDGCVQIPINLKTTLRTHEETIREAKVIILPAASTATFAGRIKPINLQIQFAEPLGFVLELSLHLIPAYIRNCFRKTMVLNHPLDIQNFTHVETKEIDWDTPIKMGMSDHPFASPKSVVPRAFRFLVESDVDANFQYYVQNLEIDWINKQINMSLYETKDFDVDNVLNQYLSNKCKRPLTVSLYDGCGVKIMVCRFSNVALHTYSTPLDYSKSDILTSKTVFQYDSVEKIKRPTK